MVSVSKRRPKYRLYRTLGRKVSFRDFKDEDIKYLWAAEKFNGHEVDPEEFKESIREHFLSNYDYAWIVEATTKSGFRPIGVIFGLHCGTFLMLGDMTWFPWASKRNIIEGTTSFINKMRKEYLLLMYTNIEDKKFAEHIARHGILKRVGTIDGIYKDKPAALFQSR